MIGDNHNQVALAVTGQCKASGEHVVLDGINLVTVGSTKTPG